MYTAISVIRQLPRAAPKVCRYAIGKNWLHTSRVKYATDEKLKDELAQTSLLKEIKVMWQADLATQASLLKADMTISKALNEKKVQVYGKPIACVTDLSLWWLQVVQTLREIRWLGVHSGN